MDAKCRQTVRCHDSYGISEYNENLQKSGETVTRLVPTDNVAIALNAIRLNNVGDFALPPTRVEALYAPEMAGEAPNARVKVEAVK